MQDVVAFCVVGYYLLFLGALLLYSLLRVVDIVFLLLCYFLRLLFVLFLSQCGKSCLLSFNLACHRFQVGRSLFFLIFEDFLYQRMVAVEHQTVCVGHLGIECHALLIARNVFHAAHILALCDEHRTSILAHSLHFYIELGLFNAWHLRAESL